MTFGRVFEGAQRQAEVIARDLVAFFVEEGGGKRDQALRFATGGTATGKVLACRHGAALMIAPEPRSRAVR